MIAVALCAGKKILQLSRLSNTLDMNVRVHVRGFASFRDPASSGLGLTGLLIRPISFASARPADDVLNFSSAFCRVDMKAPSSRGG